MRRAVGQRLGLLCGESEAAPNGPGGGEVDDQGEDLRLGAAEGAQQRVDLLDSADKQAQLSRARRAKAPSGSSRLRASRPAALPCSASRRRLPRAAFATHPQVRAICCQGLRM